MDTAYLGALYAGKKVGFVTETTMDKLKNYSTLIITDAKNVKASTLQKINDFIQDGGKIVILGKNDTLDKDEYNNIIMYDSDIDDCYRSFEEDLNEESRCDKNNYENFNECDEDIDSQKEDYDEGFKDGYEKGARDAFRAMFKLGFIPRMRISRNRR